MVTLTRLVDSASGRVYHELKIEARGLTYVKIMAEPEAQVDRSGLEPAGVELSVETDGE